MYVVDVTLQIVLFECEVENMNLKLRLKCIYVFFKTTDIKHLRILMYLID